ncbi:MAG: pirin family protein [Pyrinomonadaceae bacterium]
MRTVDFILRAAESLLPGDFLVHRALPRRELRRVGGFVFLDHFDQEDVTPELFDVPPHPHVGLQTVTYLFSGKILHTDSLDHEQTIMSGDVNWMTAGRGITHAEQVKEPQPRVHGIQSWVGLPHDKRKAEPAFEHFSRTKLPKITGEKIDITLIAGRCEGLRSPIPTFQELVYLDISADAGASHEFSVDRRHELAVYVCEGAVDIAETGLKRHELAKLSSGDRFGFTAAAKTRFILIGGEPLPDPTVIYWNFVTDTLGEAKQKMIEWETGRFSPVRRYIKRSSAAGDDLAERMQLL